MEVTVKIDIDFDLLKKQKRHLLEMMVPEQEDKDAITGIIHLIDAIQDYCVDELGMDKDEVLDLSLNFEDSDATVAVNDHHGVYVAKVFAELYGAELIKAGYKQEDLDILLAGPEHELYNEVWSELFPRVLKDDEGKEYVFDVVGESGDVWEIPAEQYDRMSWGSIC